MAAGYMRRRWSRGSAAVFGTAALVVLCFGGAGRAATPSDIPAHAPEALRHPEASLPAPPAWPFANDAFPHTSGTSRLSGGAFYSSDYLYDDQGTGSLAYPSSCTYCYANGADIWRVGIGLDDGASYWRVDWETLADPSVPVAEFGLSDGGAGAGAPWPGGSGIATPVMQRYLIVTGKGAWLVDGASGTKTAIPGGTSVDLAAQSFVVRVPRSLLPVSGTWTARMIAGVANGTDDGFATVSTATPAVNVYNVAFRSYKQESPGQGGGAAACGSQHSSCNDTQQAAALTKADVTPFAAQIDWGALARKASTPEPLPTGWSDRWYISSKSYGYGFVPDPSGDIGKPDSPPEFLGRVQAYGVWIPSSYQAGTPTPMVLALHGSGGSQDANYGTPECSGKAICVAPQQRGEYGYCVDYAGLDTYEAWHDAAAAYTLDPTRETVWGNSMGGICSDYYSMQHPDFFTASCDIEGILITQYAEVDGDLPHVTVGDQADPRLINFRWLPDYLASGAQDEFNNTSGEVLQAKALSDDGYRYRYEFYPAADHSLTPIEGGIADCQTYLASHAGPVPAPGHVTYLWTPTDSNTTLGLELNGDYWLDDILARNPTSAQAEIDATSAANPDPAVTASQSNTPAMTSSNYPYIAQEQDWTLGAAPAAAPTITMTLTNVGQVALNLPGAGFDRFAGRPGSTAKVTSDGVTGVLLEGAQPGATVTLDGATVGQSDANGYAEVLVPAGTHVIGFTAGSFRAPDVEAVSGGLGSGESGSAGLGSGESGSGESGGSGPTPNGGSPTVGVTTRGGKTVRVPVLAKRTRPRVSACASAVVRLTPTALGPVRLGATRAQTRRTFAHAMRRGRRFMDFFCAGPTGVRVGYASAALLRAVAPRLVRAWRGRAVLALTANPRYGLLGLRAGQRLARLPRARRRLLAGPIRVGSNDWFVVARRGLRGVVKVRRGVIAEVGIAKPALLRTRHARRVFFQSFN